MHGRRSKHQPTTPRNPAMTKTYANRSNARRAAKAAGLDLATLAFTQVLDGSWTWAPVVCTYANGDQLVSFSDVETPGAHPAKPYRIRQGNPARVAARKAQAAANAAQAAATTKAPATPKATPAAAGATPPHKQFAVYGRSAVLSPVQFVHEFLNAKGKDLTRKQAIHALSEAGVNYSTARTQYQRWFTANK